MKYVLFVCLTRFFLKQTSVTELGFAVQLPFLDSSAFALLTRDVQHIKQTKNKTIKIVVASVLFNEK